MTSPINYCGLTVLSPDPSGDGGLYIQQNFENLVAWSPKSTYDPTLVPSVDNDNRDGATGNYQPLSMWLKTDSTSPQLWICQNAAAHAADWRPVLMQVAQDTAPKLGGSLNANSNSITATDAASTTSKPSPPAPMDLPPGDPFSEPLTW